MESEQGWRTKGGRTFHNDPSCEWLHKGENRLRLIGKDAHEIVEVRRADVSPGQLQPCDYCCAPTWLERHGKEHRADEKPCLVLSEDEWWRGTLVWESARRSDGLWWATVTYDKKGRHVTEVHSQHDIRAR
ncbi:MAG: hypothetical protein QOF58_7066 [Pseudonocardiales bacterium]|nr:hypothetical protein [Pseudonocardiales bacterium]